MYRFTKANEAPLDTFFHTETVFDGVSLDRELSDSQGEFRTLRIDGRSIANYSVDSSESSGKDGGMMTGRSLQIRLITVTYRLRDKTNAGFLRRYERLNKLLRKAERKLSFTDEEFYFIATFSAGEIPEESSNDVTSSLTFLCHDPYKYSKPLIQRNATKVHSRTLYPARPVITIRLESAVSEFLLLNETTGKAIHMKSSTPFATAPLTVDTVRWGVRQNGADRLADLMIRSDLEDFTVSDGDVLELSVPGAVDLEFEGVSL